MPDYPGRPFHVAPGWVKPGALHHVRIRANASNPMPLTARVIATALLTAAREYHESARWYCQLLLLMPDHLHALLAFPADKEMSKIIGAWKGFQAKKLGVSWQANYFDHRIRNDAEAEEKAAYIRQNPVVKGLCVHKEHWPWVYEGNR